MFVNKLYRSAIGFLLALVLSTLAVSQEQSALNLSGFGFWVDEVSNAPTAGLTLKHVWLIADKQLGDSLEFRTFLAFQGPPRIVHTLFVKWRNPVAMVDYIRAGKFEPPFGHVNYYRIDRNPTVNYSAIAAPLVARAHGLEGAFKWKTLSMNVAAMGGERLLGNIPVAYEDQWDLYLRPLYKVTPGFSCGVSTRFGPVPAQGVDAQLEVGTVHLEAEGVSSRDTTNYTALLVYQVLPWLKPIVRYERVLSQNLWTLGLSVDLPHDAEIKANGVFVADRGPIFLGQLVLRW